MSICNPSVLNIVNFISDFFTEITDIVYCSDPIINRRLRELMCESAFINSTIMSIIKDTIRSMATTDQCDHYELIHSQNIGELVSALSHGWFNYDKYTAQYADHEVGDLIHHKVCDALAFEAERLYAQTLLQNRSILDLLSSLYLS